MAQPGWYNDNAFRAYPFVRDGEVPTTLESTSAVEALPESSILDFGCTMNIGAGYNPSLHRVWLKTVRRFIGHIEFEFVCDAPGCVGLPLVFRREFDDPEMATDYVLSDELTHFADDCEYAVPEPAWEGFLVTGDLSPLLAYLPEHDDRMDGDRAKTEIEPGLINLVDGYRVRAVTLYNANRTRVSEPDGCGSASIYPDYRLNISDIAGAVKFKEGFNSEIRQNPNINAIIFAAAEAGGAGRPCNEVPLYEGESYPGSPLLTGGPQCKDVITTINGVGGPIVDIVVGQGMTLSVDPDDPSRLIIDADLADIDACFAREELYSSSLSSSFASNSSSEIWHSYSSLSSDSACLSSSDGYSEVSYDSSLVSSSSVSSFETNYTIDVERLLPFGMFGNRPWELDSAGAIDDTPSGSLPDGLSAYPGNADGAVQEWNFEIPVKQGIFNRVDVWMLVRVTPIPPLNAPVLHGWKLRHTFDNELWSPWEWLTFEANSELVWRRFTLYRGEVDPLDVSDHRLQLWAPSLQPCRFELEALYIETSYDFTYQSQSQSMSSSQSDSAGYLVDNAHPQEALNSGWGSDEIVEYLADGQIYNEDLDYHSANVAFDVRTVKLSAASGSPQQLLFYANAGEPFWSGTAVKLKLWFFSRTLAVGQTVTINARLTVDGTELDLIPLTLGYNGGKFAWSAVTWVGSWTAAELVNAKATLDIQELDPLGAVAHVDTVYLEVHYAP